MELHSKKKKLLAASVAGLLTLAGVVTLPLHAQAAQNGEESCYGINACKGTGDCGSKSHGCAGLNSCQGKGWLATPEGLCTKIAGGSLKPTSDSE